MENQTSPVFPIALVAFAIIFIVILNHLPFPYSWGFLNYAGVFVVSCVVGGFIYGIVMNIVAVILKALVEIAAALLLFGNVTAIALCWAYFDEISSSTDLEPVPIIILLVIALLLVNLFVAFILYPLARVAGTDITGEL